MAHPEGALQQGIQVMTPDPLDRLAELMERAPEFPAELQPEDEGTYVCPCCDGEGSISADQVSDAQASGWAGGVQFYGVGHEHLWAQEFYLALRNAGPALVAIARAARELHVADTPAFGETYRKIARALARLTPTQPQGESR